MWHSTWITCRSTGAAECCRRLACAGITCTYHQEWEHNWLRSIIGGFGRLFSLRLIALSAPPAMPPCPLRMKRLPWNQAKSRQLQAALDEQLLAILHRRLAGMGIQAGSSTSGSSGSSESSSSGSSSGGCPFHSAAGDAAGAASSAAGAADGGSSSSSGARDILSLAVEASARDGEVDEQMLLSQASAVRHVMLAMPALVLPPLVLPRDCGRSADCIAPFLAHPLPCR